MFNRLRQVAVAASLFLIAACTALPGGARIDTTVVAPNTIAFDGLLAAEQEGTADGPVRYIFMVHGMGRTRDTYSTTLFDRLIEQGYVRTGGQDWVRATLPTRLRVVSEATPCEGVTSPPCEYEAFGKFRTDTFVKAGHRVVVYTYYWHEDLHLIQEPFMRADVLEGEGRSRLIRTVKEETIVMGFGDAAAYLGPGGRLVREGIAVGLCAMLREAAGRPAGANSGAVECDLGALTEDDARKFGQAEFGFVTMSLGSRMLFDTLEAHAAEAQPVLPVLARRTRYFFMLANQLPLLGLGGLQVSEVTSAGATSDDGIGLPDLAPACASSGGFLAFTACERGRGGDTSDASAPPPVTDALDVVAFHDPEDLLGFAASKGIAEPSPHVRFIEVWNRNAPVYLGLVADPRKTHAAELDHDASARLILCGARTNERGRLIPLTCR